MARIRTIKPEFPQSESMGRVSRDARLCFIMLWTIADDAGRLRGNSRMLASLLFPYDDDAKDLMPGWLDELVAEGCIVLYRHGSDSYVQICNWLIHQKIDRPSQSKILPPDDDSLIAREDSRSLTVGSKDQGPKDQGSYINPLVPDESGTGGMAVVPHRKIIDLYNSILGDKGLPYVKPELWTGKREAALRARWRENKDRQALSWWQGYFDYVATRPFLMGNSGAGRQWRADLEWLVSQNNMTKVCEGKYDA